MVLHKGVLLFALLVALTQVRSGALIFSQLGREYDHSHNNIDWKKAWDRGHAIGSIHGASGIAVAPLWVLTASHLKNPGIRVFDCADGSFLIQEFVTLTNCDLMLCRVDRPMSTYSRILKRPPRTGEVVRMYGQSSSHWAKGPVIDSKGLVKGWTLGSQVVQSMHLREGLARLFTASPGDFSWRFTAYDPEIGTNCAAAMPMDSGGGVFLGNELAGILTRGTLGRDHRATTNVPFGKCTYGYLFDTTNIWECGSNTEMYPFQAASIIGQGFGWYLDQIYRVIAPPLRVNAGGPSTNDWTAWNGGYRTIALSENDGSPGASSSGTIYRSAVFSTGTNVLNYVATNLLATDLYTLRLHFGSIPLLADGEAVHDVYINGAVRARGFDPVKSADTNMSAVLEIRDIQPDRESKASISLVPAGTKRIVYLSGLELELQR